MIQRTEVDGVPVLWAEAAEPYERLHLMFRVGESDEPLPLRGVTHLVEHLALFWVDDPVFDYNGQAGSKVTRFYAEGTREELLTFVREVCGALNDLPYDRMGHEKRVLDVEDIGFGIGPSTRLHRLRFGAASYGRRAKRPFGLPALERDAVEAWRRRWFTRGNAMIWMTGEPPETLGLDLPDGERMPPPVPEPMPSLELPACIFRGEDEIAAGFLGADVPALEAAVDVARRRLVARLRRDRGLVYDIAAPIETLGHGVLNVTFSTECKEEHAAYVTEQLLATLHELAEDGPTERELDVLRERVRRGAKHPATVLDDLDDVALDELMGQPPRPAEAFAEALDALRPAEVAQALDDALPSALLELPRELKGAGPPPGFAEYDPEPPVRERPDGPSFREKDETACTVGPCLYAVGEEYFNLEPGEGSHWTVAYEDVVAVVPHAGNAYDVLARDGRINDISIWAYHDGERLIDALRERIPADLWVPKTEPHRLVDEVAARDVVQPELVTEELEALANDLHEDERPLAMTTDPYDDGDMKPGLVAVTTERFCFIYRDPESASRDTWNETPHEDLDALEVTQDEDGRWVLAMTIDGEEHSLTGIESEAAARQIAERARAAYEDRAPTE